MEIMPPLPSFWNFSLRHCVDPNTDEVITGTELMQPFNIGR